MRSLFLCLMLAAAPALAETTLEQHVAQLTGQLRCLVCQNQTIEDSHAQLAVDLKNQVRDQLVRGASDQEVLDYMVQRYGDFVLYRPPVKPSTWLLWFGPLAMLLAGLGLLFVKVRQRQPQGDAGDSAGETYTA